MYNNSGTGKGYYFGHSQGTASIQVALSKYESELSQYLNRVVLMAPCAYLTLGEDTDEIDISQESMESIGWERELGVYSTNGPNWERDLEIICENRPDECQRYTNTFGQPAPIKEWEHIYQNFLIKRQQTFVDDWAYPDTYEGDLFDLESISTIPVSFWTGENDGLCPPDRAYDLIASRVSTAANFYIFEEVGHGVPSNPNQWFFWLMIGELTDEVPEKMTTYFVTADGEKIEESEDEGDDGDDDGEEDEDEDQEDEESPDCALSMVQQTSAMFFYVALFLLSS